jgi:hypothetical protein
VKASSKAPASAPAAKRYVSAQKNENNEMKDLPESDWRLLRNMKDTLLQRASRTAIERVRGIVIGPDDDPHKIYLELYSALHSEDEKIAHMFNDMRRSTAILRLAQMIRYGVVRPDELQGFTQETQDRANEMAGANKAL